MPTVWRQGDLLAPVDAVALGVIEPEQCDTHRVLIISHSCDIASAANIEPAVELLIGVVVRDDEATAQNGHSIRKLHLGAEGPLTTEWVHYGVFDRREAFKADILRYEPWVERRYSSEQRALLRRWLAQRYARCEFPDAFINWLKESGVGSRFEDVGKRCSAHLVGIYFDFDDDSERDNPEYPYTLGINLVYDAGSAEHAAEAEKAKARLEAMFEQRCKPKDQWRWIELTYCDVLSDEVFSLRAARTFRRWRFEHRSFDGEPIDSSE
jgi:hypothetical protein